MENLKKINKTLLICILLLQIIGVVAISSATHINLDGSTYLFNMQIIWILLSFIILFFVSSVNMFTDESQFSYLISWVLYIFNLILLYLVLEIGEGTLVERWISIGPINIQPSEFSKIFLIFFMTNYINRNKSNVNKISFLLKASVLILIPVYLIKQQPDMSTAVLILLIFAAQLFIAGLSSKYIKITILLLFLTVGFLTFDAYNENPILLYPHQQNRIKAFITPEKYELSYSYQTSKSLKAIGSGQDWGKGLYKGSLNQLSYLPEPHTDFIFSVIGEEFGFVGSMFVIILYLIIIISSIFIIRYTNDFYEMLLGGGIIAMFVFQVFINMGVTTGLLPNTGIPLPFISYGGSSMLVSMIGIALILNLDIKEKGMF